MSLCPVCSEEGVAPKGNKNAKYLLVFNKPYLTPAVRTRKDSVTGIDVLRKEFAKVGLDLAEFRIASLWLHEPTKNDNCFVAGRDLVLEEAKGKQVVVLVGAEPVEEFTQYSAADVYGLEVESASLSARVFVLPKPEGVFVRGSGVGELRLSVQKLGRMLEDV